MMKKFLACLLALVLLCGCMPALAEEPPSPVYLLVSRNEAGEDTPLGTAVLLMEKNLLLTTVYALTAEGTMLARGSGGEFAVEGGVRPNETSELALVTMAGQSPAEPMLLSTMQNTDLCSVGAGKDGVISTRTAENMNVSIYNGAIALLYSAQEGLLPGGLLLDAENRLAGMMVAAYGEGLGRYVAQTAESIYMALAGEEKEATLPEGASWVQGFEVRAEKGVLTADWSACDVQDDREDCTFYLYCRNVKNPYFSYAKTDKTRTTVQVSCAEEQDYVLWLVHAHGDMDAPAAWDEKSAVRVTTAKAEDFCKYAYVDHQFYLAGAPKAKQPEDTALVPKMEKLDAESLSDPDTAVYLQAVSTYKVEEQITANLSIVLETPEGYTFVQLGGFIFDKAYQDNDVWHSDITELFEDYRQLNGKGEMAAGEYHIRYYLDEYLANELSFTLQ